MEPSAKREYKRIPVEWINAGPCNPAASLTANSSRVGQFGSAKRYCPTYFRTTPNQPGRFQLVAGERQLCAAQLAQLHEIPAVVRDLSDAECYEIALIENIQRQDLSVIDEAQGYANLLEINRYTQEQLSRIIGKSRSHIANLYGFLGCQHQFRT